MKILCLACVFARVHFFEDFDDDDYAVRWWQSSGATQGMTGRAVPPHNPLHNQNSGLKLHDDVKHYLLSAKFPPFSIKYKPFILQYEVTYTREVKCGGAYLKIGSGLQSKTRFTSKTPYSIMFGPDECDMMRLTQIIFRRDKEYVKRSLDVASFHGLGKTSLYRLVIYPNCTVEVENDGENIHKLDYIHEGWKILDLEIPDPDDKKPNDWVDEKFIEDEKDVKPHKWDSRRYIPNIYVEKPVDWDDSREWVRPLMMNPNYQGPYKRRMIPNPDYVGPWKPKMIKNEKPNLDYCHYKNLNYVGLDLWHMESGMIFDNIVIADDFEKPDDLREAWSVNRDYQEANLSRTHGEAYEKKFQNQVVFDPDVDDDEIEEAIDDGISFDSHPIDFAVDFYAMELEKLYADYYVPDDDTNEILPLKDIPAPTKYVFREDLETQAMLQSYLTVVNSFASAKHQEIFRTLQRLCEECSDIQRSNRRNLAKLGKQILVQNEEIVHLDYYIRVNHDRLLRKLERKSRCSRSWIKAVLSMETITQITLDDLLVLNSLTWTRYRFSCQEVRGGDESNDDIWHPPTSFTRDTSKYWIRPEEVVKLKCFILRRMPYLIFGQSVTDQEQLLAPFVILNEPGEAKHIEESQIISSVYLETTEGDCYNERIQRYEGASLVRIRWYGTLTEDKEVFVERKTHHESWVDEDSKKERFTLPLSRVPDLWNTDADFKSYFKRKVNTADSIDSQKAKELAEEYRLCLEVVDLIHKRNLRPMLRTSYSRTAFQLATVNNVRLSLDTNMILLNEEGVEGLCRPFDSLLPTNFIDQSGKLQWIRFPYAVLEVKLRNIKQPPWITKLLKQVDAREIYKFSKFQHGMAFLHRDKVNILPHWYFDFKPSGSHVAERTVRPLLLCEPKVLFANERTFLHYCQKAFFSMAILTYVVSSHLQIVRLAGMILLPLAITFSIFAYLAFVERGRVIQTRMSRQVSGRLDVKAGPYYVTFLVSFILCIGGLASLIEIQYPY